MLKCASVYTNEVDNGEIAFEEIRTQLDEKITLLENSVGIIMCNPEFIGTEVLRYICENLPFDAVGVTTSSQAVNDAAGDMILTIFVITSDDVCFKAGVTECAREDIEKPTKAAFDKATADMTGDPRLAFIFPPSILGYAGDAYVRAWDKIVPNTPTFGALAIDDTVTFNESETIYNGVNYKTAMSFVLCYGNINPRFMIASLSDDSDMPYKGEVTKSEGAYIYEINNMNAFKYFESLDFFRDTNTMDSLVLTPIKIDLLRREDYDGIPVVRGHASFTEDGAAIFRGEVDEGSTFYLTVCSPEDVLKTTLEKVEEINGLSGVNGLIMISCIVRSMVLLGTNPLEELESARDKLKAEIPFMMGYSGGEICPTSRRNGIPTNRFHNYTLVMLII